MTSHQHFNDLLQQIDDNINFINEFIIHNDQKNDQQLLQCLSQHLNILINILENKSNHMHHVLSVLDSENESEISDELPALDISDSENESEISDEELAIKTPEPTETSNCPICLGVLSSSNSISLECKHEFHFDCIGAWINQNENPNCPMCRTPTSVKIICRVR